MELLTQISTIIAIWTAIYGIDAWRRQHRGTRQIELAEETLALFYEASDAIAYMRNPGSYSTETDDVERQPNEPDNRFEARKRAWIVFKRYQDRQEIFNRLHAMRYRFMAQIGKSKAKPFDDLWDVVVKIKSAAMILSRLWAEEYFPSDDRAELHHERVTKYETIFWSGFPDDDVALNVTALVADMEATCQAIVAGSGTLYAAINKRLGRDA